MVGGLFIGFQTLIAERVPHSWRGIVLTIPSTVAIGLFFIGLTKTPADVVHTSMVVPAGMGATYAFAMAFALLVNHGILAAMPLAFASWGLFALVIVKEPPANLISSIFIYSLPITVLAYLIIRKLPQVHTLKKFPLNFKHIVLRSLIGGSVILMATLLAKTLGNVWGALFSSFPAVFSSTFIIFYTLQGKKVIPSVAKSLFFPGSIGLIVYSTAAAFTFPAYGIWIGTLLAYLANFIFVGIYYAAVNTLKNRFHKNIDVEALPS